MEISLAFVTNTTGSNSNAITCYRGVASRERNYWFESSRERYGQADVANEINPNCEERGRHFSIFNLRNVDRTGCVFGNSHRIQVFFCFNDSWPFMISSSLFKLRLNESPGDRHIIQRVSAHFQVQLARVSNWVNNGDIWISSTYYQNIIKNFNCDHFDL